MKNIQVHAHRGASAYAPENTMSAFNAALDMKADFFELDVHLTLDGQVVVTHDFNIARTSNGTGVVEEMSLDELRKFDFGSWFKPEFQEERIPTLEQVMDLVKDTGTSLNIEIKANPGLLDNGIEKKVIEIAKAFSMENRVVISSFNHYCLAEVKRLNPEMKTGILYVEMMYKPWEYARILAADAIHPNYKTLLSEITGNCIKNNVMVNTWTLDKPEDIKRAVGLGVTGIITNVPDAARRLLYELSEEV